MPLRQNLPALRALGLSLVLSATLGSFGCIDLDSQSEISDLRILGVALDPPEIVYSAFMAFPADQRPPFPEPPTQVQARVLAADPRNLDQPVRFVTKLCPENNTDLCRNYALPEDLDATEREPEALRAALTPLINPMFNDLNPGAMGLLDGPLRDFSIAPRAVEYMLPHSPDGAASVFFQDYARVVLYAESQDVREVAYRRLPLNVNFDLSFLPAEIAGQLRDQFSQILGIEICTPEQALEPAPPCLAPRQANKNPIVDEMRYSLDGQLPKYDEDGEDTREIGEVVVDSNIRVQAGQRVTLWPVLNVGHSEPYQVFEINLQESTLVLNNYTEDVVVSWYASQGSVSPRMTPIPIQEEGRLNAEYIYPETNAPDQVMIYLVVRDQRGGMTWQTVQLVLDGA